MRGHPLALLGACLALAGSERRQVDDGRRRRRRLRGLALLRLEHAALLVGQDDLVGVLAVLRDRVEAARLVAGPLAVAVGGGDLARLPVGRVGAGADCFVDIARDRDVGLCLDLVVGRVGREALLDLGDRGDRLGRAGLLALARVGQALQLELAHEERLVAAAHDLGHHRADRQGQVAADLLRLGERVGRDAELERLDERVDALGLVGTR